jgi:hypothetical protein
VPKNHKRYLQDQTHEFSASEKGDSAELSSIAFKNRLAFVLAGPVHSGPVLNGQIWQEGGEMKPLPKLFIASAIYLGPLLMVVWFIINHYFRYMR